jgi:transcriptional regulator with XRE-family HTH domain
VTSGRESGDEWFGANLRAGRDRLGIGQRELARLMTEDGHAWFQSTVARAEAGRQAVRVMEAASLARILATTVDMLTRPPPETAALMMADHALGRLHSGRAQVIRSVAAYLRARDGAVRAVSAAQDSPYESVRGQAAELAAELGEGGLDEAVEDGIWKYEHPEGAEDDDGDGTGTEADTESEPGVVGQPGPE